MSVCRNSCLTNKPKADRALILPPPPPPLPAPLPLLSPSSLSPSMPWIKFSVTECEEMSEAPKLALSKLAHGIGFGANEFGNTR